jgi:hypothetical protein
VRITRHRAAALLVLFAARGVLGAAASLQVAGGHGGFALAVCLLRRRHRVQA